MKDGQDNYWIDILRQLCGNKAAVAGLAVFLAICLSCALAPLLTTWDYAEISVDHIKEPPSAVHLFGTDYLGRDVFTRMLYGGRLTLRIAFLATAMAATAGSLIGLLAGYFGGRVDMALSPALDVVASVPVILLVIVTEAVFGWGRGYFMYAMAVAAVPQFARLARATVMQVMGREYIEAARALGLGHAGILLRHVLHNAVSPLIIRFTGGFAEALLTCTIVGYLGIGINPPTPEWGVIVYNVKDQMRNSPTTMIIPCAVIALCVISISLFGDGLRDALDPRGEKSYEP